MKNIIRFLGNALVVVLGQSLIMSLIMSLSLSLSLLMSLILSQPARAEEPKFVPSRSHCTDPKLVHVPAKLTPAQCEQWFQFETKHAKTLRLGHDGRLYLSQVYADASISLAKLSDAEFAPRKKLLAENLNTRFNDLIYNSDTSSDKKLLDELGCKYDDLNCVMSNMDLYQKILAGQCHATDNLGLQKICETAKQNGSLAKLSDPNSNCTIDRHSFRGEHSCPVELSRLDLPFGKNIYSSRDPSGGTCGDNYYFYGPAGAQGQREILPDGQLCLEGEVLFRFAIGQAVPDILLPFYNQTVVLAWQKTGAGSWVSIGKIDDPFEAPVGDFDYATQTKVDSSVVLYKYRNIQKRLVDILDEQYEKFEYGFGESYNKLVTNSGLNCLVSEGSVPHDRTSRSYLQVCADRSIYLSFTDYLSPEQNSFAAESTNSNRAKSWLSVLGTRDESADAPVMSLVVYAPVDSLDQLPEPIKIMVTDWVKEFSDPKGFNQGKRQLILRKISP